MNNRLLTAVNYGFCFLLFATLSGCGGGGGESTPLAARIHINKVPDQQAYAIDTQVEISTLVLDANGDALTGASVQLASNPVAGQQNGNHFLFNTPGTYTITATVLDPTQDGVPVTASLDIVVDDRGPEISCDAPLDGAMLSQAPGDVMVQGRVSDLSAGVGEVQVNGASVVVDGDGAFSTLFSASWGINFIDLTAFDDVGNETRRTCAFLLSETWAPDDATLPDTISLKVRQAAIDDGGPVMPIHSINDILDTVLNSSGLRDSLHAALLGTNPIKDSCDASDPIFDVCLVRSRIRYLNSRIDGPNWNQLRLVSGGLYDLTYTSNLAFQFRVDGQISGIPYDTTGWVTFEYVDPSMTFDPALDLGQLNVSVRPGTPNVNVGPITMAFGGLDGAILNTVSYVFNSFLRTFVGNMARDYVTNNFNAVLDDIMQGLDVHNLSNAFDVPRLDGAGVLTVAFGTDLSSLNTSGGRMLIGMGTQFQTMPAHARPTLGAPVPSGARLLDATTTDPIATGLHLGLVNQAVHALWRGGYFDAVLAEGALNGLVPPGATIEVSAVLPPAISLRDDGRVEMALGAVHVQLDDPVLLNAPLDAVLGGRASCALALSGDALLLEDCAVSELHLSTGNTLLDAQVAADVEQRLTGLLNIILSSVVTDALPAMPLPGFDLPASLTGYGIPAGELGLMNPMLTTQGDHFILGGGFGIR